MALGTSGAGAPYAPIPQKRIVEKLDAHMGRNDYAAAERHLLYWLSEACAVGDARGELMVRNELVGHFRKTGKREEAFAQAEAALRLVGELGLDDSLSAATTLTNAATALSAFGENDRALDLFSRAQVLYESAPDVDKRLVGGLYNNMALASVAAGRFDAADDFYRKAIDAMGQVENGELEQAISYLNMADAACARAQTLHRVDEPGEEGQLVDAALEREVCQLLDKAAALLDTPSVPHDGYYAFVCEKCAPTFAHYGYFLVDADLRERAKAIYERA